MIPKNAGRLSTHLLEIKIPQITIHIYSWTCYSRARVNQHRSIMDKTDKALVTDLENSALKHCNKKDAHLHKRDEAELPADMHCGLGPCTPRGLQCCARMGVFVGAYSICGLMTSVLSMYIVSQITTIEKQFGLSSAQSGFLLSCNDIGFLLTTLIASYFARKVHIPRTLWASVVLYGIAGLVCSVAYFVSRDFISQQGAQLSRLFDNYEGSNVTGNVSIDFTITVPSRQYPMCIKRHDVSDDVNDDEYSVVVHNSSDCDVKGAETSFGVGEPNKYTNVALTLMAIGTCNPFSRNMDLQVHCTMY